MLILKVFFSGYVLRLHISIKRSALSALGGMILAFGLFNVHSVSAISEGGTLGLVLLLDHWFDISPAISGLIINAMCFALGISVLGREFIIYSAFAGGSFSLFYALFEKLGHLWPNIGQHPVSAAILGALFVGTGVGIATRSGGATCGDDALAMALSKLFGTKTETVYFLCDLVVLVFSLSYIPLYRIIYSLATVALSGKIIGIVQRMDLKRQK